MATTQDLLSLARQVRGLGRQAARLSQDDFRAAELTIVTLQLEHIASNLLEISKAKAPLARTEAVADRNVLRDRRTA